MDVRGFFFGLRAGLSMTEISKTNKVVKLNKEQIEILASLLREQAWEFSEQAYAYWKAKKEKVSIVAYCSGKVTIQGKGTDEVVEFILEPHHLGCEPSLEAEAEESATMDSMEPHIGIDESGKGDYFGPLIIAACYVDQVSAEKLKAIGVTDSKLIKSDQKILSIADKIKSIVSYQFSVIVIGNTTYNQLYERCQNLNRLLAWGHARALENVLEKVPSCQKAISDQFGSKGTVSRALMERGRKIILEEHPRAEADIAVAAASILARAEFVLRMNKLAETAGFELPKGAGEHVKKCAVKLGQTLGEEALGNYVKLHFKTTESVHEALCNIAGER